MIRKTIPSHLMALSWLLSIPLLGTVYVFLNRHTVKSYSLVTDIDRNIPFLKIFILPYVSWFLFIFVSLIYLCIKNRRIYYRTLLFFNVGLLVCYGVYFFFQTSVPRPSISGNDWLTNLVRSVYQLDKPYNCFPSTHVLTSYLLLKAFQSTTNIPRYIRAGITFMSFLIMISILFVKQHVLLDLIGGIAVAEVIYFMYRWGAAKITSFHSENKHSGKEGSNVNA